MGRHERRRDITNIAVRHGETYFTTFLCRRRAERRAAASRTDVLARPYPAAATVLPGLQGPLCRRCASRRVSVLNVAGFAGIGQRDGVLYSMLE